MSISGQVIWEMGLLSLASQHKTHLGTTGTFCKVILKHNFETQIKSHFCFKYHSIMSLPIFIFPDKAFILCFEKQKNVSIWFKLDLFIAMNIFETFCHWYLTVFEMHSFIYLCYITLLCLDTIVTWCIMPKINCILLWEKYCHL